MAQTKAQLLGPVVGDVTIDTNTLSLDAEGNKVGIGTTGATAKLHVFEPTEGDTVVQFNSGDNFPTVNRGLILKSATGPTGYTGSKWIFDAQSSGGRIEFQTASTPRLAILETGKIFIGSTNEYGPTGQLLSNKGLIVTSDGENSLKIVDTTAAASNVGASILLGGNYRSSGDTQSFVRLKSFKENATDNNYAYGFSVSTTPNGGSFAEALRITSAGNIGIGTDNPLGKLVVSDGANGLEFNPNSNNAIVSYNRTTSAYAPNGLQGSTVQLRIGGVGTALHVHSDGLVGIGTITPSIADGNGLHIAGSSAGIKLQNTNNSDWAFIEYADESNTTKFIQGYRDASGLYAIRPGTSLNATPGISLTSAGNVGIGEIDPANRLVVQETNASGDVGIRVKNDTLTDGNSSNPTTASLYLNTSTGNFNTFYIQARRNDNNTHFGYADPRAANHTPNLVIASDGTILAGGQTSSYDGGFVNLELRKDSTTVGGSMTLVNGQSATAGATCQIDCYQNFRSAGRIVFGRENANNWQAAAGGAASFLSFYTNNAGTEAEKLRITSGGNLLIGHTTASNLAGGFTKALGIEGTGAANSSIGVVRNANDDNPPYIYLGKSRGSAPNANNAITNSDHIGMVNFAGAKGSGAFGDAVNLRVNADASFTASSSPGRFSVWTTPVNSTSPLESLRVDSTGAIVAPRNVAFSYRRLNSGASWGSASGLTYSSLDYRTPIPLFGASGTDYDTHSALSTFSIGGGSGIKFTAPVSGKYMVTLNMTSVKNLVNGDWGSIGLMVNTVSQYNTGNLDYMLDTNYHPDTTSTGNQFGWGGSVIINLSQNDYIVPYSMSVQNFQSDNQFFFQGYLLG